VEPRRSKIAAVALALGLVGYSATAGLAVPGRRHPLVQAALGTALAALTRAPLGLRGAPARAGLEFGAVGAAAVAVGVSATTAVPAVRAAMRARDVPTPGWKWLTVEIPLGTVWSEETMYRAALGTAAADAFGPGPGRLLQAAAFGLSHIVDARAAAEPVAGTVLVTGAAGWLFGWLAGRSGSVLAPALAHLAINEAGAVAALAVQRRARRPRRQRW
jgi:uncharacterized protein